MKRRRLVVSIWLVNVLLVCGIVVFLLLEGAAAQNQLEVALTTMLTSHTRWQTLNGTSELLIYNPNGRIESYRNKFAVVLPNRVYMDAADNNNPDLDQLVMLNGEDFYDVKKKTQTYIQSVFPSTMLDTSNLPVTLGQLDPNRVALYPLQRTIGLPAMEYIFPIWFPQVSKGGSKNPSNFLDKPQGMQVLWLWACTSIKSVNKTFNDGRCGDGGYTIQGETSFLGHKVWIIERVSVYKDHVVAWVDQKTGVILKYDQWLDGKKIVEMFFTSFDVNQKISPKVFVPEDGFQRAP